jgi:hypothetical protein
MPTIVKFPQHPRRGYAHDRFSRHIPPHLAGYALILALALASLVLGPPTMHAGKVQVDLSAAGGRD